MNLGELYFSLTARTEGLQAAAARLAAFSTQVTKATAKRADDDGVAASLFKQEKAAGSALQAFTALDRKLKDMAASSANLNSSMANSLRQRALEATQRFVEASTPGNKPVDPVLYRKHSQQYSLTMRDVNAELSSVRFRDTAKQAQGLTMALRSMADSASLALGPMSGLAGRIMSIGGLINHMGASTGALVGSLLLATTAITGLGTAIVQTSMRFQQYNMALTAVNGNTAVAASEMNYLVETAMFTGNTVDSLSRSYTRYSAAAKAVGYSQELVRDTFRKTAMAASVLQLGADDTMGVFRALEQILSKGTVQAEELRGQLADRFPAAFNIAAQAIGVTTQQLNDMMKKGQVISKEFVPAFIDAMTKMYNIDITKPVQTIQASINRLITQFDLFLLSLDRSTRFSQGFTFAVDQLAKFMGFLTANINQVLSSLTAFAVGVAVFFALPGIMAAASAGIAAFTAAAATMSSLFVAGTFSMSAAWQAFSVAFAATPWGAVISIVLRLIVVLGAAAAAYLGMKNILDQNAASLSRMDGPVDDYIAGQQRMLTATRQTTLEMIKQRQVILQNLQDEQSRALDAVKTNQQRLQSAMQPYQAAPLTAGSAGMANRGIVQQATPKEAAERIMSSVNALNKSTQELNEANNNLNKESARTRALLDLANKQATMPDGAGAGGAGAIGSGKTKAERMASDLRTIQDLIRDYKAATDNLSNASLLGNVADGRILDDMRDALRIMEDIDPSNVGKVADMLAAAGINADNLFEGITSVITATRQAQEQTQQFMDVWQDITNAQKQYAVDQAGITALMQGGNETTVAFAVAVAEAGIAIDKLSGTSLKALEARLIALGASGNTVAEMLANITDSAGQTQRLTSTLQNLNESAQALADARELLSAANAGALPRDMALLTAQLEAQKTVSLLTADQVTLLGERLKALGFTAGTVAEALAAFNLTLADTQTLASIRMDMSEELNEIRGDLTRTTQLLEVFRNQGYMAGIDLERAFSRRKHVEQYVKAMQAAGASTEEINRAINEMLASMEALDDANEISEKQKAIAQQARDAWIGFGDSVAESFESAILEGKKLGDVTAQLEDDFKKFMLRTVITNPLKRMFADFYDQVTNPGGNTRVNVSSIPILGPIIDIFKSRSSGAGASTSGAGASSSGFAQMPGDSQKVIDSFLPGRDLVSSIFNVLTRGRSSASNPSDAMNQLTQAALRAADALNSVGGGGSGSGSAGTLVDFLSKKTDPAKQGETVKSGWSKISEWFTKGANAMSKGVNWVIKGFSSIGKILVQFGSQLFTMLGNMLASMGPFGWLLLGAGALVALLSNKKKKTDELITAASSPTAGVWPGASFNSGLNQFPSSVQDIENQNGGPTNSVLQGQQRSSIIVDNRTEVNITVMENGQVSEKTLREIDTRIQENNEALMTSIGPYVDTRVSESRIRGRV